MEKNKIDELFPRSPEEIPFGDQSVNENNSKDNANNSDNGEGTGNGDDDTTNGTGDNAQLPPKKNHQDRRWDKLFGKLEETTSELSELRNFRQEVISGKYSSRRDEVPEHFKKMYEDGLTMEERWKANQEYEIQREKEIEDRVLGKLKHEEAEKKRWDDHINTQLEDLEERFKVDFTSGSSKAERLKREFLAEVIEFSPKDEHGNLTAYAPFDKVCEGFLAKKQKPDTTTNQKKDISALSGQRSTSAPAPQNDIGDGGWYGWMKHMKG